MIGRLKNKFQVFTDQTTIQGFHEFYYAKSSSAKIFWLLLIIVTNVLTAYQIIKVVEEYRYQTGHTKLQQLSDDLYFPPLRLCYAHWIYWVDTNKTESLGFSYDSLLYGLTFIQKDVFVQHDFNWETAKQKFKNAMIANNFSTLKQFYLNIANKSPLGLDKRWSTLTALEFNVTSFSKAGTFCYHANINELLSKRATSNNIINNMYSEPNLDVTHEFSIWLKHSELANPTNGYIDDAHRNRVIKTWFRNNAIYENTERTSFSTTDESLNLSSLGKFVFTPLSVFIFQEQRIISHELAEYVFKINVNVKKWRNDDNYACIEEQQSFTGRHPDCEDKCHAEYYATPPCNCPYVFGLLRFDLNITPTLCQYCFYIVDDKIPICKGEKNLTDFGVGCDDPQHKKTETNNACLAKCKYKGCQTWGIDYQLQTPVSVYQSIKILNKEQFSNLKFIYPTENAIVVVENLDSVTWEDFVSNVGGLLGVWMGASILSYVQMFYLFCCSDEECCSKLHDKKKEQRKNTIEIAG